MIGKRSAPMGVGFALLALLALSCAPSIRMYVNPDADMAFYRKIGVLPFTNSSQDGLAGPRVTRAFVTELIMTNRYQIVQPEEIRSALHKAGAPLGNDGEYDPAKLRQVAEQSKITGFVRGSVTEYLMQQSDGGGVPVLAFDVELIDANTGDVVWRSSIAKRGKSRIPFGGTSHSLGRLTQEACGEVVTRLAKEKI
jgi:hypothetical protein